MTKVSAIWKFQELIQVFEEVLKIMKMKIVEELNMNRETVTL